jgi:hypothetical protein
MSNIGLIIIPLITIVLVIGVTNMYRNRKNAIAGYNRALELHLSRVDDYAKENGFKIDDTYFTVTDTKEGLLLAINNNKKLCVVSSNDEIYSFKINEIKECDLYKEEDGEPQYYTSLGLKLVFSDGSEKKLILGYTKRKIKSYIASMVQKNVEDLQLFIKDIAKI